MFSMSVINGSHGILAANVSAVHMKWMSVPLLDWFMLYCVTAEDNRIPPVGLCCIKYCICSITLNRRVRSDSI